VGQNDDRGIVAATITLAFRSVMGTASQARSPLTPVVFSQKYQDENHKDGRTKGNGNDVLQHVGLSGLMRLAASRRLEGQDKGPSGMYNPFSPFPNFRVDAVRERS
jgi:hypothetical protein